MNNWTIYKEYWTGWDGSFLDRDYLYREKNGNLGFTFKFKKSHFHFFQALWYLVKFRGTGMERDVAV